MFESYVTKICLKCYLSISLCLLCHHHEVYLCSFCSSSWATYSAHLIINLFGSMYKSQVSLLSHVLHFPFDSQNVLSVFILIFWFHDIVMYLVFITIFDCV
jgi:hypothetical protein